MSVFTQPASCLCLPGANLHCECPHTYHPHYIPHTPHTHTTQESLELDEYDTDCDGRSYGLSISSPDPESVCVFTGNYSYPFNFTSDVVLSVDPVTCLVTPPTLLHCTPSTLHWRGTHSTNFTGLCFTPHLHQVILYVLTLYIALYILVYCTGDLWTHYTES